MNQSINRFIPPSVPLFINQSDTEAINQLNCSLFFLLCWTSQVMMHSVRAVTVCEPFCVRVHKYIFVLDSNILRFSYLSTKRSESFIRINPQSYPFFFSFYSPISFSSCSMRAPQFIKTGNSAEENMHRKRKKTTINEQLLRQNQKFVGKKQTKKTQTIFA